MDASLPNPRVSVVMCTYRGTSFLEAQLETLLEQTLQPVELVVSDDSSGDRTISLLEKFRERAPFPVHLHVNAQRLGSTPNFDKALELATGDLLALCDQDDLWLPHKLATMACVFEDDLHKRFASAASPELLHAIGAKATSLRRRAHPSRSWLGRV